MRGKGRGKASIGLDTTVFDAVIEAGDVDACRQLAVQLAAFLANPEAPAIEKHAVVPAVLKLAGSADLTLRRDLGARLARCRALPADIVFTLAADADDIALPFLAAAHAIDSSRMLAILQVGDGARQAAIAGRPDICPEAVTVIASRGGPKAITALLDNRDCRVRAADFRAIFERFADRPAIVQRLLARADFPIELRILHARQSAGRVHSALAEPGFGDPQDAELFLAEAEETAVLRILEACDERHLDRLIAFLSANDMLHASLILRAACRGRMAVVEGAIAWLSSLPKRRVHALMTGHGRVALKAVYVAAGLPSASFALFKAAVAAWRRIGPEASSMPPEDFGRHVVEASMTHFPDMPGAERARLLELVARFTEGRTRALADRLREEMLQAA